MTSHEIASKIRTCMIEKIENVRAKNTIKHYTRVTIFKDNTVLIRAYPEMKDMRNGKQCASCSKIFELDDDYIVIYDYNTNHRYSTHFSCCYDRILQIVKLNENRQKPIKISEEESEAQDFRYTYIFIKIDGSVSSASSNFRIDLESSIFEMNNVKYRMFTPEGVTSEHNLANGQIMLIIHLLLLTDDAPELTNIVQYIEGDNETGTLVVNYDENSTSCSTKVFVDREILDQLFTEIRDIHGMLCFIDSQNQQVWASGPERYSRVGMVEYIDKAQKIKNMVLELLHGKGD